jgi:hypothetical protein
MARCCGVSPSPFLSMLRLAMSGAASPVGACARSGGGRTASAQQSLS